jgi:hypothetical protein
MDGFGAGKGSLPRPVDTTAFGTGYDGIDFSSKHSDKVPEQPPAPEISAEEQVLKLRLRTLALWCEKRATSEHCVETTLTMLYRKVSEVEASVRKAGWQTTGQ